MRWNWPAAAAFRLRHASARWRYAVCALALLLCLCIPTVHLLSLLSGTSLARLPMAAPPAWRAALQAWMPALVLAWSAGVGLMSLRLCLGLAWVGRLRRQAVAAPAIWQARLDALALRMGMSANTLTHKVNPNNTTHHLTLREAVTMQHMSGNVAVLQAMAEALGYVCVKAKPAASGDPLRQVMEMSAEFADVLHAASDAISAGQVTPNAMRRFDYRVAELQAAANAVAGTLRAMMPVRGEVAK